ncbi:MAG: hypothetical protein ABFR97_00385 [Thermodesulfobacteriota bacterium]
MQIRKGEKGWLALIMIMLLCLSGCAANSLDLSLVPPASAKINRSRTEGEARLGVANFVDLRPLAHANDNQQWKGMIPGVLWLEISSDIPEVYTPYSHYDTKPLDRAASLATVDVLDRSGLFREVVDLQVKPDAQVDYVLEGILHQAKVTETCYYYGSFTYAWLLRIIGLPYVSFAVDYHMGVTIRARDSGEVVWQGDFQGSRQDKYYSVYGVSRGRQGKHVIAWNIADIWVEEFNRHAGELEQVVMAHGQAAMLGARGD